MEQILQWEDLETLALLFGMMIIVNVLSLTGLFNFLAVWSYKRAAGNFWTLIAIMSLITASLSAFIDNVSTMLLMAPTLVKLSELEHIDPRYMLMIMVIFCNLGGCATPVGDPPNLIIIGHELAQQMRITFGSFAAICGPCVLITMLVILAYLRLKYKSKESLRMSNYLGAEPRSKQKNLHGSEVDLESRGRQEVDRANLETELEVLQSIETELHGHPYSKRLRRLQKKVGTQVELIEAQLVGMNQTGGWCLDSEPIEIGAKQRRGSRLSGDQLKELMRVHCIKSKSLLWKSLGTLLVVTLLFFAQSIPGTHLTLGWISLFGGLALLAMSSSDEIPKSFQEGEVEQEEEGEESSEGGRLEIFDYVINNIEWSTLMFFFSLFIVMEVMEKLGLISFMGKQITLLVDHIPPGRWRSIGAITIILWSSGIASACIDNVPFTSMMIKVLATMAARDQASGGTNNEAQLMSLKPLVFALVFGSCYGGNGSLIGASANLITAGVAGRYGYPISFNWFFKFSSLITVLSLIIANIYLVLVFVLLEL